MTAIHLYNAVRVVEITAFVVLALFLPTSIRVHARPGRNVDSNLLAWCVWAVFAAGIAAILHRWDQPLRWDVTMCRLLAVALGAVYVVRNRPHREPRILDEAERRDPHEIRAEQRRDEAWEDPS